MKKRSSGILLHITSLPSDYGIGDFGKEAYNFVDFLKKSGQKYWQILPLGPIGFGNSPYQSFSSYGGNHLLIDIDDLIDRKLIDKDVVLNLEFCHDLRYVDYENVVKNKDFILRKSFEKFTPKEFSDYGYFILNNSFWLEDYSLYMALKKHYNFEPFQKWEDKLKLRDNKTILEYKELLMDEINYWKFVQYIFYCQWKKLKTYANDNGILIIGDIPIYVATDSADSWANGKIFKFDENMENQCLSGCPPDSFTATGQLWGNPIYDWEELKKDDYKWWIERIRNSMKLYDVVRIDHFRGLESYWEVPRGHKTAEHGRWVKGPGIDFINVLKSNLESVKIIAEDLGYITKEVKALREASGFPGMKVLQFAFDSREESDYLPHNYERNSVVYTGTHDNDTVNGWINSASEDDVNYSKEYFNLTEEEGYNWGFIRGAWSSVSNLAIAQMQDFLGLDSSHRMNIPSTLSKNWIWRVLREEINGELAEKICHITKIYGRINI